MTKADRQFKKGMSAFKKADYETAVKVWQPLADMGHAGAQNFIGVMYEWGNVLRRNKKKAVQLYRKSAMQGNVGGQFNLDFCYESGIAVKQDDKKALYWFLLAAEQGDLEAQWRVSRKYQHGEGVKRNLVEAYKWHLLFAKGAGQIKTITSRLNDPPAKYLSKSMTAAQLQQAKSLAKEWRPSKSPPGKKAPVTKQVK